MSDVSRTQRILATTLLALACRVAWLRSPSWQLADSAEYLQIASGLLTQGAFTAEGVTLSSYRPPLYPALLAGSAFVLSDPIWPVLVLQTVLGALTVTLTYLIAERAFGSRAAVIAAVMLALSPMTARFAAVLLTETTFTFFVVAGVWAWLRQSAVISGVLFGAAILTRASVLPFVGLIGVCGIALYPRARHARVVALVAALAVAPWVIRNVQQFGRVTVADAGWGLNLLYGTVELKSGSNRWAQLIAATPQLPPGTVASFDLEQRFRDEALRRIHASPAGWLRARLRQYPQLFINSGDYLPIRVNGIPFRRAWSEGHLMTIAVKVSFLAGHAMVLLLSLYGLSTLRPRLADLVPLWSFPLFLAAAHVPMYVEPRYGLPLAPFVAMFAAVGVMEAGHHVSRRRVKEERSPAVQGG